MMIGDPLMMEIHVTGFVVAVCYSFVAAILIWAVLFLLDMSGAKTKGRFSERMQIVSKNPLGLGFYLGMRFFGVCYVFATIISG